MSEPIQCDVCKGDGWRWADIPEDRCKACLGTGFAKTDLERAEHEMRCAERDLGSALDTAAAAVKRRDRALVALELLKRKTTNQENEQQ